MGQDQASCAAFAGLCALLVSAPALGDSLAASSRAYLLEDSHFLRDAASERIQQIRFSFREPPLDEGQSPAWARAFGSHGSADGDHRAPRRERDTGGLLIGSERKLVTWFIGAMGGYSATSVEVQDVDADIHSLHLGAYAGTKIYNQIGVKLGAAWSGHDGDRRGADADGGQVFGELSYSLDFRDFSAEGFSELAYVRQDSDALGALGSQRDEIGYSTFGLRGTTRIELASGRRLTARISSGWRHAYSDSRLEDESGAAVALTRDTFRLDAGLDYQLTEQAYAGLFYNGTYAEDARDNGLTARVSLRF
ncbi:autotransporter outer membrane beta-barrel domain-containing protein [Pseudomonas taiwanensis]|uniref:autotransporter outer membrane beta-barrel domain-containing protein n=1 Tax=Pseudomonas taiwanensis TaxID=470150 RepID=UPI0015BB7B2E|nr:autotransporter domain-containing protein [Pseudomonas taiwanensis]NWL77393.1 autotransporter outer membrane beta-barrel domain-containing protein [Pseudomonas taiwanensis]